MPRIALSLLLLPFSFFAQTDGQILIQKFAQVAPDSTPELLKEMWFDTAGEILKTRTPGFGESYFMRDRKGSTETTFSRPFENQTVKKTLFWPIDSDKPWHIETVRCTRFATGDTVMEIATWEFDDLEPREASAFVRRGDTIKEVGPAYPETFLHSKWDEDYWVLDSTGAPVRGWETNNRFGIETSYSKDSIVVRRDCLICGIYRVVWESYLLNEQGLPTESFNTTYVMSDTSSRSLASRYYYENPHGLLSKIENRQSSRDLDFFGIRREEDCFVVRSTQRLSQAAVRKINAYLLPSPSRLFFLTGGWQRKTP